MVGGLDPEVVGVVVAPAGDVDVVVEEGSGGGRWKDVGRSPKKPSSLFVLVRPREPSLRSECVFSWAARACSFAMAWARRSSAPPGVVFRFVRMSRSRSGIVGS